MPNLPFPSDADIDRIATENRFYQLYKSNVFAFEDQTDKRMKFLLQEFFADDKEKMKLLMLSLNIAPSIVRAGANFLFGKQAKIEVSESTEAASDGQQKEPDLQKRIDQIVKRNKLHKKLKASARTLQAIGHTQFKFRKENGKAVVEEVPFDSWFPSLDNLNVGAEPKTFDIVSYLTSPAADGVSSKKYIYVEEHTLGQIAYSLYYDQGGKIGEPVALDTLQGLMPKEATLNGLTAVQQTGIDELTVEQLDADKDVKDRMGESILKQIEPVLNAINLQLTQIALQMLKHLDPILEMPDNDVPRKPDGTVDRRKLEIIFTQQGDVPSRYVTNDNPMIEQNFTLLKDLIAKSAKLTDTPNGFIDDDEKGGVESAESIRARFMLFFMRIDNYRSEYDDGIKRMVVKLLKIEGVTVPDDLELKITFDYGLPRDLEVDGRIWGQAVLDGIASVETAIKNFQAIDDDLLDEEMARIQKDQELAPPLNITGQAGSVPDPQSVPKPSLTKPKK